MRYFNPKVLALVLTGLALNTGGFAAAGPASRMIDLKVKGVDLPAQTLETPAAEVKSYGDNAVQHCYVFSSFAAFETDSGQVGAELILVRLREAGQSVAELCKMPRRAGDRVLDGVEGNVLGARGPYLFVTSTDSSGSQGDLAIYKASSGERLFNFQRNNNKPVTVRFDDGVLSLHFFVTLQLDCDLAAYSCWPDTLQKNGVPPEVTLVRPICDGRTDRPGKFVLSALAHVADVEHPTIAFENSQPTCEKTLK